MIPPTVLMMSGSSCAPEGGNDNREHGPGPFPSPTSQQPMQLQRRSLPRRPKSIGVDNVSSMTWNNATSLIVAGIALVGVLISNWWTNRAAEKRRAKDQAAADQRRRADQEAEEKRRQADQEAADKRRIEDQQRASWQRQADQEAADKRRREDLAAEEARRQQDRDDRERERLEKQDREDRAEQRKAVAECVRTITEAARRAGTLPVEKALSGGHDYETIKLTKAVELTQYYQDATNALALLDLELNDDRVRIMLEELWDTLTAESQALEEAKDKGSGEWLRVAETMAVPSSEVRQKIRDLQVSARLLLLQYPNHEIDASKVRANVAALNRDGE